MSRPRTPPTLVSTIAGQSERLDAAERRLARGSAPVEAPAVSPAAWARQIPVNFLGTPTANNGTWSRVHAVFPMYGGGTYRSTNVLGSWAEWPVAAAAGDYTLDVTHQADADRGIYTVTVDGIPVGTVDGYNASVAPRIATLTGFTIPASGDHLLRVAVASKNGSSSGYVADLGYGILTRI